MPTSPIILPQTSNAPLMDAIGRATGGMVHNWQENKKNIAEGGMLETALKQLAQNPNATTQDVLATFAGLQQQGVSPQTVQSYMEAYPKFQTAQSKVKGEEPGKGEDLKSVFSRMKEIREGGRTGYSLSGLTPKGRSERAEFNTLGEMFMAQLIPLVNRGALSKPRFDYIKGLIPRSTDTDAAIDGKLSALSRIFDIETGQMKSEAQPEAEKSSERQQSEPAVKKIKLRHKGSKQIGEVPEEKFMSLSPADQELYEKM